MKALTCEKCGASDWKKQNGLRVCNYCGTSYKIERDEMQIKESEISLNEDVERLLEKCKNEPYNAKKYANLILDIDPSNIKALRYL